MKYTPLDRTYTAHEIEEGENLKKTLFRSNKSDKESINKNKAVVN